MKKIPDDSIKIINIIICLLYFGQILGPGMSDKMWNVTTRHALTCVLGNKLYSVPGNNCVIILNSICNVVGALTIDGQLIPANDPSLQTV